MYQRDLLRMGALRAVDAVRKMFSSELTGHVSDDLLRNYKYLFVASITLGIADARRNLMLKARQLMDFAATFRLLYLQEILSHMCFLRPSFTRSL